MNKCVFVTGGTKNSGAGIVERFAREGWDVFIGSRKQEEAEAFAAQISQKYGVFAKGYGTKIFDEDDVNRIFDDIRSMGYLLDCLVCCAANLGIKQQVLTVDVQDFMDVINTNIGWNFMLARAAAKQMIDKGHGSIVFINSNTAYRAIPDRVAYSCSKGGVLSMSRALALDLGKYKIRVNCVLPGMIKTDRWWETVESVRDFMFLGSKITADGDCSHEIKRHLLLGKKVMTNLDSIFKSRDITLPTKVRLVKAMVFPVVMYGYESWTVKIAEH